MRRLLSFVLVLAPVTACDGGEAVCSTMGCGDGILITASAAVGDGSATVEVTLDGKPGGTWTCPGGGQLCTSTTENGSYVKRPDAETFVVRNTPKAVDVGISVSAGPATLSGHAAPTWSSTQPNGKDCEPTCWNAAAIELTLKAE